MSDESRFDCQCKCPECVNARQVIRNLKKRMRSSREALTPLRADPTVARVADRLLNLKWPWPNQRTNYDFGEE